MFVVYPQNSYYGHHRKNRSKHSRRPTDGWNRELLSKIRTYRITMGSGKLEILRQKSKSHRCASGEVFKTALFDSKVSICKSNLRKYKTRAKIFQALLSNENIIPSRTKI